MTKGCRILVAGRICRFVEIIHSAWDGTRVIYTDSKGRMGWANLNMVRVPRKKVA